MPGPARCRPGDRPGAGPAPCAAPQRAGTGRAGWRGCAGAGRRGGAGGGRRPDQPAGAGWRGAGAAWRACAYPPRPPHRPRPGEGLVLDQHRDMRRGAVPLRGGAAVESGLAGGDQAVHPPLRGGPGVHPTTRRAERLRRRPHHPRDTASPHTPDSIPCCPGSARTTDAACPSAAAPAPPPRRDQRGRPPPQRTGGTGPCPAPGALSSNTRSARPAALPRAWSGLDA